MFNCLKKKINITYTIIMGNSEEYDTYNYRYDDDIASMVYGSKYKKDEDDEDDLYENAEAEEEESIKQFSDSFEIQIDKGEIKIMTEMVEIYNKKFMEIWTEFLYQSQEKFSMKEMDFYLQRQFPSNDIFERLKSHFKLSEIFTGISKEKNMIPNYCMDTWIYSMQHLLILTGFEIAVLYCMMEECLNGESTHNPQDLDQLLLIMGPEFGRTQGRPIRQLKLLLNSKGFNMTDEISDLLYENINQKSITFGGYFMISEFLITHKQSVNNYIDKKTIELFLDYFIATTSVEADYKYNTWMNNNHPNPIYINLNDLY